MGRIVVITGANRGIGLELVRQLAQRGDRPILTARREEAAAAATTLIDRPVTAHQLDVTDPGSVVTFADRVTSTLGRVDVLINNAAIRYDTWESAADVDFATVREALETNTMGAWACTLALLPLLRHSHHPRVVNVSSEGGSLARMSYGAPAYRLSKAGLNAVTRMLAAELHPEGVLVNAVCPGWIATDMGGPGGAPMSQGAGSVLWAADLPDDGPTGGFFRHGQPLPW